LLAAVLVAFTVVAIAACASRPEQPILNQFFTASRLRDSTSLQNFATVSFDPGTSGTVNSFSITSVGPEQKKALNLRALGKALDDVQAEDDALMRRKVEYQNANMDAIRRLLKAERDNEKLKGKDAEVQATWTKFREEMNLMMKRVAEAKNKFTSESSIIERSVYDPRNPVDVKKYDAELVVKDVMVSASVKQPGGQTVQKPLVVTMQRAVLRGDREITGRWVITGVKDASVPAGTKSS
jgi:hypothetical protein